MPESTVNLIIYIEQLAALVATSIAELKSLISGDSTKTADQVLADADAQYQSLITPTK